MLITSTILLTPMFYFDVQIVIYRLFGSETADNKSNEKRLSLRLQQGWIPTNKQLIWARYQSMGLAIVRKVVLTSGKPRELVSVILNLLPCFVALFCCLVLLPCIALKGSYHRS